MSGRAEDMLRVVDHGFGAHSRRPAECRTCRRPQAVHERTESGWLVDPARVAEPVEHARTAAEAVRALNHVTLPGGRLTKVSDLDTVVTEIGLLLSRLPQALRQCAAVLDEQATAGRVADDSGRDVVEVVAAVRDLLGLADLAAQDAAGQVRAAGQHTARLFRVAGASEVAR